jgi:multiple sugar transport system ATP-binding protein
VFLFDEPLSNLDAALRGQTRIEIAELHRDLGATTIYVTHDQVEAMTLADRVVVLRDGVIEQVGSPLELYDRPANRFVAQFIGTPQMNVIDTKSLPQLADIVGAAASTDGFIGVRPEHVSVLPAGQGRLAAKVELVESLGSDTLIYSYVGAKGQGAQLVARQNTRTTVRPGDTVGLDIAPDSFHLFDRDGRTVTPANSQVAA